MADSNLFSFENHSLHTELIDGEPWFLAKDLCEVLAHSNSRKAIADHVDPKDVTKRYTLTAGGRQLMTWVNESGMYALIFGSKLPSALRFKRWVTSEVLPALRRKGTYSMSAAPARRSAALPKSAAPAMPPLMRPLEMIVRSQSGARYSAWELWHRKFGPQGWIPDWTSGGETAALLHAFKGGEGGVVFSILDLCMMCGIDPDDPALIRFAEDSILVTSRISEAFNVPYSDRLMLLCGPSGCARIARSARTAIAEEAGEWLFNCVFPCFGIAIHGLDRMRDAPNLLWLEREAM